MTSLELGRVLAQQLCKTAASPAASSPMKALANSTMLQKLTKGPGFLGGLNAAGDPAGKSKVQVQPGAGSFASIFDLMRKTNPDRAAPVAQPNLPPA